MYFKFIKKKIVIQDSGRSSDSSSRTSLDSHRVLESPRHNRHLGTSLSTSTSTPIFDKKPLQEVNSQQTKNSTEKNRGLSKGSGNSAGNNTTTAQSIIGGIKPNSNISVSKQKSFDVETSLGIGGCYSNYGHENLRGRSKPDKTPQTPKETVSSGIGSDLARSYSFIQRRDTFQVTGYLTIFHYICLIINDVYHAGWRGFNAWKILHTW